MAGGDELLPIGQKGNYKKYIETATSSVVAEQVTAWLQPSTSLIGLLSASTAQIGHVVADLSTAKIGALQASTESIGYVTALVSTAKIGALQASTESIGLVTAIASTAKIGALQPSTESIGYVTALVSTAKIGALQASTESIGYVTALVSTAKIGGLQASTESIGYITLLVSTAAIGSLQASTQKIGALQASTESIGYVTALVSTAKIGALQASTEAIGSLQASTQTIGYVRFTGSTWVTLLAAANRSSDVVSSDQSIDGYKTVIVQILYNTATGAALTPSIDIKDGISSGYKSIWTAAATISSTGHSAYLFDLGGIGGAGTYTEAVNIRFANTWRLSIAQSSSGATNYSASADLLV